MKIETSRLILREWNIEDAKWLYEYAKDPLIGPIAGWLSHKSVEYSEMIINKVLSQEGHFAVYSKRHEHIIGGVAYHKLENSELYEAEVGYWIAVPLWSCGYASEALKALIAHCFNDIKLERLRCSYFEGNNASKAVAEKCGFVYDHSIPNVYSTLLNIRRIEHVTYLERDQYLNNLIIAS